MAEYKLPTLGETATQGIVAKVLVAPGDSISQDQSVLELETDKAVLEVPSTVAGTIKEVLVKQGDTVKVDQPIFIYEGGAGAIAASAPTSSAAQTNGTNGAAPATPTPASKNGAPEQTAASEAKIAAPAENKPAPTIESQQSAAPSSTPVQADGISQAGAPPAQTAPAPAAPTPAVVKDPAAAAPSVRRLAREIGVDIHAVQGTGLGNRITEDDVKNSARGKTAAPASNGQTAPATMPAEGSKSGQIERVPMSGIRRATLAQMDRAWTIPHVTQFDKADITEWEALRKKYGPKAEKAGAKLTPTAMLLKVVVGALKKFPNFNASIDFEANEIVQKRFYNIGVAVDTPAGLVVPVLRDVERKSMIELAVELGEIAGRARDRKLKPEEMTGGTFTVTNLGGIGGTAFTPIVNTPEVAILGIARGGMEPVWNAEKSEFEPRLMMPLCLSYDHRVIDGADGARFLRWICGALEDPFLISLEG